MTANATNFGRFSNPSPTPTSLGIHRIAGLTLHAPSIRLRGQQKSMATFRTRCVRRDCG